MPRRGVGKGEIPQAYGRFVVPWGWVGGIAGAGTLLKTTMVVRAALLEGGVTLQFHPDAPVEVDKLVDLVRRKKDRYKLSQDYQLTFRPEASDWDGLLQETKNVLRELQEAC